MISKDKTEKQKDIDDVLSSIDSLLDTATDISADDLPILELEPEQEADKSQASKKIKKVTVTTKAPSANKKATKTSIAKSSKVSKRKTTEKKEPTISGTAKAEKEQPPLTNEPQEPIVSNQTTKPESKPTVTDQISTEAKEILPAKTEPKESNTVEKTKPTDFSAAQRELPILDEIITEEEMALIAAGKELPKRIITEKFAPKSTTDKIVNMLAIQLADYNITRLEYEYIHELIDEILADESNEKTK